jgi:hypothetical protein
MKKLFSIVEKVVYRSLTGQSFGLDVHQHFEQMTLLYWNVHSTTGCYESVLARYFLENDEFDCFVRKSVRSGLKGVCDCMYG